MKKIVSVLISIFSIITVFQTSFAEDKPVTIKLNDNEIRSAEGEPYINNSDRTMVPMKFILKNLDCEAKWYTGDIVSIQNKTTKILFTVGEYNATVTDLENGESKLLCSDSRPVFTNNEVIVPLRFVAELMDSKVDWDNDNNIVNILSKENEEYEVPIKYDISEKTEAQLRINATSDEPELLDVDKAEIEKNSILKELSKLQKCTSISKRSSDITHLTKYRFTFQEENQYDGGNINPVLYFDLNSDLSAMSFCIERDNDFTASLFKKALSIIYKDNKAQDAIVKQLVKQREKVSDPIINTIFNFKVYTEYKESLNWEDEGFNVIGTIYRLK